MLHEDVRSRLAPLKRARYARIVAVSCRYFQLLLESVPQISWLPEPQTHGVVLRRSCSIHTLYVRVQA